MTEQEIKDTFGKSIWDMTTQEIVDNNLVHDWVAIVDANANEDPYYEMHESYLDGCE